MIVFVLFVYDNDESNTGFIEGVYKSNDDAQDAGEDNVKGTDSDYYVVARTLRYGDCNEI